MRKIADRRSKSVRRSRAITDSQVADRVCKWARTCGRKPRELLQGTLRAITGLRLHVV